MLLKHPVAFGLDPVGGVKFPFPVESRHRTRHTWSFPVPCATGHCPASTQSAPDEQRHCCCCLYSSYKWRRDRFHCWCHRRRRRRWLEWKCFGIPWVTKWCMDIGCSQKSSYRTRRILLNSFAESLCHFGCPFLDKMGTKIPQHHHLEYLLPNCNLGENRRNI